MFGRLQDESLPMMLPFNHAENYSASKAHNLKFAFALPFSALARSLFSLKWCKLSWLNESWVNKKLKELTIEFMYSKKKPEFRHIMLLKINAFSLFLRNQQIYLMHIGKIIKSIAQRISPYVTLFRLETLRKEE